MVKTNFLMCLWACFWMSLAFELVDWVKDLPLPGWVGIIQSVKALNRTKFWKANHFLSSALRHYSSWFSGHWTPRLRVWFLSSLAGSNNICSPVLRSLGLGWSIPLAFLAFQLAEGILWDFSASITARAITLYWIYFYRYIYPIGSAFPWRTLTNTDTKWWWNSRLSQSLLTQVPTRVWCETGECKKAPSHFLIHTLHTLSRNMNMWNISP